MSCSKVVSISSDYDKAVSQLNNILSQLNAPIPMKYIRQNEEKSVINTPSGKGYGVENFQNGENNQTEYEKFHQ